MNGAGITGESPGGKIGWILNLHFIPGYTPRNQNLDLKKKNHECSRKHIDELLL